MPTTFLNVSLAVESDEPLDILQAGLHTDIEYALEEYQCKVFSVTPDREQALRYLQARKCDNITVLTPQVASPLPQGVAAVLAEYNWTLPKQKKGEPEYRAVSVVGEVHGLPTLRGKVVLTNGIMAYLVIGVTNNNSMSHWCTVHWDSFVPDDLSDLPEDLAAPELDKVVKKRDKKMEESFAGF